MTGMTPAQISATLQQAAAQAALPKRSLAGWRAGFRNEANSFATALHAGCAAGELGFCFAGGYQAALRRMLPALPGEVFVALLVTEGKRQRPEDLHTLVVATGNGELALSGEKSWVAGGAQAGLLLVLARHGNDAQGRAHALLVAVPATDAGVTLEEKPATGFLDAVPHARARFDRVAVTPAMILPGDGWRDYARPFRTIEDIHVSTAIAAHLAVQALRRNYPDVLVATLVSALAQLAACAERDPNDPLTHLLLAGVEQQLAVAAGQLQAQLDAAGVDDEFAGDWRRNGMLLALAAPVRARRLEKARLSIFPAASPNPSAP